VVNALPGYIDNVQLVLAQVEETVAEVAAQRERLHRILTNQREPSAPFKSQLLSAGFADPVRSPFGLPHQVNLDFADVANPGQPVAHLLNDESAGGHWA